MFSFGKSECLRLSFAGVVFLTIAFSCTAQTSRVAGTVQGSVADQTGSAVAGATVTLRNQGTNQTRTMLTNAEGVFRAGELPVGQYELRVESSGFSPYVNNAIVVDVYKRQLFQRFLCLSKIRQTALKFGTIDLSTCLLYTSGRNLR